MRDNTWQSACSWPWTKCFPYRSHLIFTIPSEVGFIIVLILWVRKYRVWFYLRSVWLLTPKPLHSYVVLSLCWTLGHWDLVIEVGYDLAFALDSSSVLIMTVLMWVLDICLTPQFSFSVHLKPSLTRGYCEHTWGRERMRTLVKTVPGKRIELLSPFHPH